MQPHPERRKQLADIEHRGWQLWAISLTITACLTFGMTLLLYPTVKGYAEHFQLEHRGLPQLLYGLVVLVVLSGIYTVLKQRELNALRNYIIASYAAAEVAGESYPHDTLTGLLDRSALADVLKKEMDRAVRIKQSFCLALLDINDFRRINEREGNLVGDIILKEFAIVIRRSIRQNDLALRYGPDAFLCILEGSLPEGAETFVRRLEKGCQHTARLRAVTFSVVLAECQPGEDPEQIIADAETSLANKRAEATAAAPRST